MKPSYPLALSVNEELQQLYFRRSQITQAIECLESIKQMRSSQTFREQTFAALLDEPAK